MDSEPVRLLKPTTIIYCDAAKIPMHRFIFVVYLLSITYASVRPLDSVSIGSWDKFWHFALYAMFAVLGRRVVRNTSRYSLLCVAIFLYSGVLELVQSQVPGREMSLYDLIANGIGVAVGFALSKRYLRVGHT